ncbi:MAG: hypothetical protein JWO73_179 [Candidatus Taylorbacteria bacterium]|nr:hypothetical protein [Candidatus Taylorbacteria bacterium]
MKSKPIIAIDIDDVIAANASAFVEYSNRKYGTNLTIDDYQEHWAEVWKVEHEEVKKRAIEYHESGHIATYSMIDGAYEALKQLKERFRLVAVTSRRNSINQLTKEWIQKYYPDIFDTIVFCGFFDSEKSGLNLTKGDLVKNMAAEYFIDDQIKHVSAVAENGIKSLLFGDYFWNKTDNLPENVLRVKNWQEAADYFTQLNDML